MTQNPSTPKPPSTEQDTIAEPTPKAETSVAKPREIGGRKGLEPTRYGDWEKNGRCIDF